MEGFSWPRVLRAFTNPFRCFHNAISTMPLARQARELLSLMHFCISPSDPYTNCGMHQEPVDGTQNSEMQIHSVLSTRLTWLLLPYSTLDIPTGSSSQKLHTEKPLGSQEKGLWMISVSLEHSCKLEVNSCSDLHEIRYPYNFQHMP